MNSSIFSGSIPLVVRVILFTGVVLAKISAILRQSVLKRGSPPVNVS